VATSQQFFLTNSRSIEMTALTEPPKQEGGIAPVSIVLEEGRKKCCSDVDVCSSFHSESKRPSLRSTRRHRTCIDWRRSEMR
jgi:hypothetical protein